MKKDEDEKPQGSEGARFNRKQGFKKKTTISKGAKNRQTPPANSSKVSDSVWGHTVLKCTRKQYTK